LDIKGLKTELQAIRTQFDFLRFASNKDEAMERLIGRMLAALEHMASALEAYDKQTS
jgi:hypothetical protein